MGIQRRVIMGFVNADSSAILEAWQSITNAVSSVEATKATISRKYKQLGSDWNDKKYRELGDIVQECNKSFNTILRILYQAEKPVSLLAKSLQQYEETNFGNGSVERSHASFVESLQFSVLVRK